MEEIFKDMADAITEESESITFEIDVEERSKWKRILFPKSKTKIEFEIKPLTLNQLYRVSKLLLDINLVDFTPTGILKLMMNHGRTCAHVIAIAVTDSRQKTDKKLIDLFFNNLSKDDLETALKIVMKQMNTLDFINTIASIRNLNVLETTRPADVKSAKKSEASPIVPGDLSVVS